MMAILQGVAVLALLYFNVRVPTDYPPIFGKERDPAGEFHEAHEMSVFNTDPRFMDEKTFLLHFMAYPPGYKIPWMHYWNAHNLNFREEHFIDRIQPL
jgi:hypothetical protein